MNVVNFEVFVMYHFFVRRRIEEIVRRLNAADYDYVLAQFSSGAHHWFSGEHALGGLRTTGATRSAWYARLKSVLPGLRFEVLALSVSGWPWRTQVALEWVDHVNDRTGAPLDNRGVFFITLAWGKAVDFRVYCDTALLQTNLRRLQQQGVSEAALAPVVG